MIPKRIEVGEVLHGYPAATHNWVIDNLQRLVAQQGGGGPGATSPLPPGEPHVAVDCYNSTASELPQHGVVSLEAPEFDPSDDGAAQQHDLVFRGVDADADLPFGVLRLPIMAGNVGPRSVVVSGPALVRLNLTDTAHTTADVSAADNDKLHSSTSGRAAIMWFEKQGDGGDETGEQWAVVMLGGSSAPAEPTLPILAKVTEIGGIPAATLDGDDIEPGSGELTLYTRPATPGDPWVLSETAVTGFNNGGDIVDQDQLVWTDEEYYVTGEFCNPPE